MHFFVEDLNNLPQQPHEMSEWVKKHDKSWFITQRLELKSRYGDKEKNKQTKGWCWSKINVGWWSNTGSKKDEKVGHLTSLPTGIPLPRAAVRPMTLATNALRVKYSFRTTPLRMVFSSGIPEPANENKGNSVDMTNYSKTAMISVQIKMWRKIWRENKSRLEELYLLRWWRMTLLEKKKKA